ncbi:MAG: hypothetical protein KC425_04355, partial [Anaerolineales bacterium]|nr:hypothetical protein [Anaerolineales bacterium]
GFLGGRGDVTLAEDAAYAALSKLGQQLKLAPEAAALGMLRVVNAVMERALRRVSVERGHDPRDFTLVPFGGAGPLHACDMAAAVGIQRILIPPAPGVLSAYGMLVADIASDAAQSILRSSVDLLSNLTPLETALATLDARVRAVLLAEGVATPNVTVALDMRYRGQSYELTVPVKTPLDAAALQAGVNAFHQLHEQRYGYAMPEESVQVVTLRVRGSGPGAQAALPREPLGNADPTPAHLRDKEVWFGGDAATITPCYARDKLSAGQRFAGPALVLQFDATTVVAPGWSAHVDEFHNLWLERPLSSEGR